MIDYNRIINSMQSQPIPPTTPRIGDDMQNEIGQYFWDVAHHVDVLHHDTDKANRLMASSFHTILMNWNFGKSPLVCAESLAA